MQLGMGDAARGFAEPELLDRAEGLGVEPDCAGAIVDAQLGEHLVDCVG